MRPCIVQNEEEFTDLVMRGYTIPELMEYYECTRSAIATAKRRFNLVGKTPNSQKANLVDGTKHCFSCNTTKSLNDFHSNGYTPKGSKKYKAQCKSCDNVDRRSTFVTQLMRLLDELNTKYECADCSVTGEYGLLDFHHRNPVEKKFDIGIMGHSTYTYDTFKEKIKEEILKCDIVCPTCHRKRHLLRG